MPIIDKPIVLIGLMGTGKTTIGKKLAKKLQLPFTDSDEEAEQVAGCSIENIFEFNGEEAFRKMESLIIQRLLSQPIAVIAAGGGAFVNTDSRAKILREATSVWLKADIDVLVLRTARRRGRPLLNEGNPRQILKRLMRVRYPVYAEADITVEIGNEGVNASVNAICAALEKAGILPSDFYK
ncbi:MAG: hypothetical protein CBB68_07285 [Rhodospirillaceae bacterium TMED8]|nr:shikimate kinase [Magnetovibrio sp.]OUT50793.1 MAG: hypothetical protein CBB68_07285 [Rhodospirillaceae bacterium TMED8]|tara:strand:- start:1334 stop:1879 length:546 start_codon:yes stop_codon:yes gene_type:complete